MTFHILNVGPLVLALTISCLGTAWAATPASKPTKSPAARAATVSAPPAGDAQLGREKADNERCIECHGQDGQGSGHPNSAEAKFAKLAGQKAPYIVKQVLDFRANHRKYDQMNIVAKAVDDQDLRDIAAWFSSLPVMKGEGGADLRVAGKELFAQGDASRGVLPCASCHGAGGSGQGGTPDAPRLAGQEWRYLDKQLRDWRDGSRRNSPDGVMNRIARALTDKEIEVIADYLAAQ